MLLTNDSHRCAGVSFSSIPLSSFQSRKAKHNNGTPTHDRHLQREKDDEHPIKNITIDTRNKLFQYQTDITTERQQHRMNRLIDITESDDEDDDDDDDDMELLNTLSQLHMIIPNSRHSNESDLSSSCSGMINQEKDLSLDGQETRQSKKEIINEPSEVLLLPSGWIHSSSSSSASVIDRREKVDVEEEEKNARKKSHFHLNHNEKQSEEKCPTTHFSFLSTSSSTSPPTLFNRDESQILVDVDSTTYPSTLTRQRDFFSSLSNITNDTILFTNQLLDEHLTMNNNQMTSDLFDPFAPTTMFDNLLQNGDTTDMKHTERSLSSLETNTTQPLADYDFDDLWNQSIAQLPSNPFTWETLLTDRQPSNITWESLFDQKIQSDGDDDDLTKYLQWLFNHFDDSLPSIIHTSIKPSESISSPSLIDDHLEIVVEKLVSSTLEKALDEINRPYVPIESFVEQILAQAIFEVYQEDSPLTVELEQRIEDDTSTLSEYFPPSIIANPHTPARLANNLMKYSLTAPVFDDSGDDSSMIEDFLPPGKVLNRSGNESFFFSLCSIIH